MKKETKSVWVYLAQPPSGCAPIVCECWDGEEGKWCDENGARWMFETNPCAISGTLTEIRINNNQKISLSQSREAETG